MEGFRLRNVVSQIAAVVRHCGDCAKQCGNKKKNSNFFMELLDGNENAEIVSQILLWSRSMGDSSHLVNKSK